MNSLNTLNFTSMTIMCSHHGFPLWTEYLRWPPCRRNSSCSGNCNILCWWKIVRQDDAIHYPGKFEMGEYAVLSSEGGLRHMNCGFSFLTQLSRVSPSLFSTLIWGNEFTLLTNKIYRGMLSLTRHEKMTNITMPGLNSDHVHVSALSMTPMTPQHTIVLSWNLLTWISTEGRIPCSFTNFITTPELSGPLYISPDIYHAQITEYSLQTIHQWALFSPLQSSSELLIVLDPPPLVLTLAFSIRTGSLLNTFTVLVQLKWFFICSDQFVQNVLYVNTPQSSWLIRWRLLLGGFRSVIVTCNRQTLILKIRFVSRVLVPNDRATCTIASRVNSST